VKIKNTSAIPLRAAYLHGPYTLYVACYPTTFDPNKKHENHRTEGVPHFEPNLKAGGHWNATLTVPEDVRQTAGGFAQGATSHSGRESFTWIIEVASQILFSTSAAVHFELLVGRDEKSVELGFGALTGTSGTAPGQIHDHLLGKKSKRESRRAAEAKGIYSKAVDLVVDDTGSLWNTPEFPSWDEEEKEYPDPGEEDNFRPTEGGQEGDGTATRKPRKRKKVHLVVLTHGLHSNLGADMLYTKECIDKAAQQAKLDARKGRAEFRVKEAREKASRSPSGTTASQGSGGQTVDGAGRLPLQEQEEEDDEEQVIVRGFSGNAVRTERGIQYLGKRLAKYVLHMTYPDQPYLPVKTSTVKSISRTLTGQQKASNDSAGPPVHAHSSIHRDDHKLLRVRDVENLPHKITSISFISHSLGGLIQTYAIAYIQKHSPEFFDKIRPINFVAMASPFLGLSNENPIYVKFALDFGLVGRTGQDLGLTWRAPTTIVRSGWAQMIGGLGGDSQKAEKQGDPGSKPLLRILPSGPAHQVLKKFRNRTVYSNVVNDGIVPLRTSCLLFLDWRGLGRVDKARRENGLVGTMAGWGWAELTGANASNHRALLTDSGDDSGSENATTPTINGHRDSVPQPSENETTDNNDARSLKGSVADLHTGQFLNPEHAQHSRQGSGSSKTNEATSPGINTLSSFMSFFKPQAASPAPKPQTSHLSTKKAKIYKRSQTLRIPSPDGSASRSLDDAIQTKSPSTDEPPLKRPPHVRGDSLYAEDSEDVHAPPKTTFFESAGDLLNPPLPPDDFLIDPESRPRTIFHDRVYHPSDIPPPPTKPVRTKKMSRSASNSVPRPVNLQSPPHLSRASSHERPDPSSATPFTQSPNDDGSAEIGPMKVEEKIARAYHHDLSWRKVLVRLEPDAHNNMIVRRMFANAYGWPVIKHMVDTHFAYTIAAETDDSAEADDERARPMKEPPTKHGEEVHDQVEPPSEPVDETADADISSRLDPGSSEERTPSENREARDEVPDMIVSPTSPTSQSSLTPTASPTVIITPNPTIIHHHTNHPPHTLHSTQSSTSSTETTPSQLTRQESGRWSDRYFEDSEGDDDEDEDVDPTTGVVSSPTKTRLRRAFGGRSQAQGASAGLAASTVAGKHRYGAEPDVPHDDENNVGQKGTSEAEIADFLSPASPISSHLAGQAQSPSILAQSTGEGDSTPKAKPVLVEEPKEMAKPGMTEDLMSMPPLTTVGLGSRKLDAGAEDAEGDAGPGTLTRKKSLSERVARFSAQGD
jgi:hypothetical protein